MCVCVCVIGSLVIDHVTGYVIVFVQMLLQQLQQQCEPVNLPDAVCRYSNCLQYHASTDIQLTATGG